MSDAFHLRPNDLLKYEIILWAKSCGKQYFVLGGGAQPGDGMYRYKLSFAPCGSVPFYTGRRIINQALYERLVANKGLSLGQGAESRSEPRFFPAYRR